MLCPRVCLLDTYGHLGNWLMILLPQGQLIAINGLPGRNHKPLSKCATVS